MTEQIKELCQLRGCDRAVPEEQQAFHICGPHRKLFDAQAALEAWGLAESILRPWVESTKAIGSDELTLVMDNALCETEAAISARQAEIERLEAKL